MVGSRAAAFSRVSMRVRWTTTGSSLVRTREKSVPTGTGSGPLRSLRPDDRVIWADGFAVGEVDRQLQMCVRLRLSRNPIAAGVTRLLPTWAAISA